MLPDQDMAYLAARWPGYSIAQEGTSVVVILRDYELPAGFAPQRIELCLLLPFGFPETQPDMFWADPAVTLHGRPPAATEVTQQIAGRSWQRFSRHLAAGAWRAGMDNLQSWISMIGTILEREAGVGRMAA